MVKINIAGAREITLHEREFNEMAQALQRMVQWQSGGMYGDGDSITDKTGYNRAIKTLIKIGYSI